MIGSNTRIHQTHLVVEETDTVGGEEARTLDVYMRLRPYADYQEYISPLNDYVDDQVGFFIETTLRVLYHD